MSKSNEEFETWQIGAVLDGLKICNSVNAKNSNKCKQCPYYGKDCLKRLHNEAIQAITVKSEIIDIIRNNIDHYQIDTYDGMPTGNVWVGMTIDDYEKLGKYLVCYFS